MRIVTRTTRSGLIIVAVAALAVAATAAPAFAADGRGDDRRITLVGPVRVDPNERVYGPVVSVDGGVRITGVVDGAVFVVRGNVSIVGRVKGAVTVLDGTVRISGQVDDPVTVVRGRAIVERRGVVLGDVRSSLRPLIAPGARVTGDIEKTDFAGIFTVVGWVLLALWWLAVTATLLVVGIVFVALFPRAAQAVSAVGRKSPGVSIAWGAILGIAAPVAAAIAVATLVGIPLGFAMLFGLAAAFPVGYIVTALVLGRALARGAHEVVAFLIGFTILRALAIVPGLGWLVGFLAAAFGVGVLAIASWRAGRESPAAPTVPPQPAVPSA